MPSTRLARPGTCRARLSSLASVFAKIPLITVDLPEPDTPVMQHKTPNGMVTLMPRRLFSRAPTTVN